MVFFSPRSALFPNASLFLEICVLHVQAVHFVLSACPSDLSSPLGTTKKINRYYVQSMRAYSNVPHGTEEIELSMHGLKIGGCSHEVSKG